MNDVLLRVVCAVEAGTGLVILASPTLVAGLLLGSEIGGAGIFMSRVGAFALIALGIACWPGSAARGLLGMTVYSVLTTLYMAGVGLGADNTGALLWPAAVGHGVLSILLARLLFKKLRSQI